MQYHIYCDKIALQNKSKYHYTIIKYVFLYAKNACSVFTYFNRMLIDLFCNFSEQCIFMRCFDEAAHFLLRLNNKQRRYFPCNITFIVIK